MAQHILEIGEESGRLSRASADYTRLLGRSYVFQVTLCLAAAAWLISFVSQAIVTAKIGNGTVGTLWFAIFIQLGIIASLIITLRTNTLFQHGIPLAILAALATSLGAQGVDRNVYVGAPSQKALSAGWLITCIVDVIWIVLLSSEPSSFVFRLFASGVGGFGGSVRAGPSNANTDAFAMKYSTEGVSAENQQRNTVAGSAIGSAAGNDANRNSRMRTSVAADPETQKRRSAGVWSGYTPPQSVGETEAHKDATSVPPESSVAQDAAAMSDSNARATDVTGEQDRPDIPASSIGNSTDTPKPVAKAMALFEYTASPTDPYELSFSKGEMLDVLDKTGKWWEAVKSNGTRGIAPSNYLKLL